MTSPSWPALALARLCNAGPRVPFLLSDPGAAADRVLGSVDERHVDELRAWPDAFEIVDGAPGARPVAVRLTLPPGVRDVRLATINAELHRAGLIVGWRDEPYPLRDRDGGEHGTIERAASRFWGTLTVGAHCNGYVQGPDGRPTHLWIARRAHTKPTDPGRLDNLVGGGVPRGQTPREAVIREGWEEAGLKPAEMAALEEGSVIELDCDVAEGRQHELLVVFDLALPVDRVPRNVDGEVAEHRLMTVDEALRRAAAGELTTDAALATLDFAVRHRLIEPAAPAAASTVAAASVPGPGRDGLHAFEALKRPPRGHL